MIKKLDLQQKNTVQQVWELQMKSYEVEAEIIGQDDLPPLRQSKADLQRCEDVFFGYYIDESLEGVLSAEWNKNIVQISRLMVHPRSFKRDIASKLLRHLEEVAPANSLMQVTTARNNLPAVKLYTKHGYRKKEDFHTVEGITISMFQKRL